MEAVTYDEVVRVWAQERFGLVDPPRNIAFFPYEDRATCGEGTCDFTERGVTVLVDGRGFDLVMDNMATLIREIVAVATVAG